MVAFTATWAVAVDVDWGFDENTFTEQTEDSPQNVADEPAVEQEPVILGQEALKKLNQALLTTIARFGSKKVEALIEKGASVHARNRKNKTPLHIAANLAKAETVNLLLDRGANPLLTDNGDKTPLQLVENSKARSQSVREVIITALKNAEAKALHPPESQGPPLLLSNQNELNKKLLHAVKKFGAKEVEALIKEEASVHARNCHNKTPLHVAAAEARLNLVKLLLKAGANPLAVVMIKDKPKTPWDLVNESKIGTQAYRNKIKRCLETAEAEERQRLLDTEMPGPETIPETLRLELSEEELARVDQALLLYQVETETNLQALDSLLLGDLGQGDLDINQQHGLGCLLPSPILHLELSPEELERVLLNGSPRPATEGTEPPRKQFRGNDELEAEGLELEPLFADDSELLSFLNGDDDDGDDLVYLGEEGDDDNLFAYLDDEDGDEPEGSESILIYNFTNRFVQTALNGVAAAVLFQNQKHKY